ncbi:MULTISPECIES: hypothetical protein [unclassified Guyparkeria]|uniref:hypothetical protein n=1 Tax=unclassified Guyparkeria TaxID=2626246 RepID=UPI000733942A|nr:MULTISPECIES: hypothetical protein [unclassified Guyparkeria]KTG17121.1 hypothetical protein AUR63_10250 [Guyparkeria sp. XI15]OAE86656.1 hypothetical protein AWR35_10265 [Guyparkeria sp. WRN-7]
MSTRSYSFNFVAFALLALAVLVYWPGLTGGYVFDDFPNLVNNDRTILDDLTLPELWQGAMATDSGPLKRPIAMLSLSVERYFFGLDPGPMKFTNLVIHLVNAFVLFLLARLILTRFEQQQGRPFLIAAPMLALLVSVAWAVSPINLTAVLFVIQRMESLATLFMLLGLLGYWRGRDRLAQGQRQGLRWMWGSLVLGGGFGVLAKESAVMLPLYALLLEWMFFGFGRKGSAERGAVLRLYGLLLVIPAVMGLAWLLPRVLGHPEFPGRPFDVYERLWTEARVIWHYLAWIVAPNPGALSLYHDAFPLSRGPLTPWTTLISVFGLVLVVVVAVAARNKWRLISFGILWFFVMHLLVSTFLNLELVYEHRNYLGSFGILLAVFAFVLDGRRWELAGVRRFFVVSLVVLYGFLTFLRANEWSDSVQLAYFEASRHPDSPRASYALGQILLVTNEPGSPGYSLALAQIQDAANLPNASLLPLHALIFEAAKHGRSIDSEWWEAMRDYAGQRVLSAQDINALFSLVNAHAKGVIRLPAEPMIRVLDAGLERTPAHAQLITLKANFLLNVPGNQQVAEVLLREAVVLRPSDPDKWRNLIDYQIASGQFAQAAAGLRILKNLDWLGEQSDMIADLERSLSEAVASAGGISGHAYD